MTELNGDKLLLEIYGEVKTVKSDVKHMTDGLTDYRVENEKQHEAMWTKYDKISDRVSSHGKAINKIYGGIGVIAAIATGIFAWMKHKLGG